MLTGFDWLRRSRNGQELLATLLSLAERPDLFAEAEEVGPISAHLPLFPHAPRLLHAAFCCLSGRAQVRCASQVRIVDS